MARDFWRGQSWPKDPTRITECCQRVTVRAGDVYVCPGCGEVKGDRAMIGALIEAGAEDVTPAPYSPVPKRAEPALAEPPEQLELL